MRTAVERQSEEVEKVVRDIRRATRRQYTAEEKVRIVIAGLRGVRYNVAAQACPRTAENRGKSAQIARFVRQLALGERLRPP